MVKNVFRTELRRTIALWVPVVMLAAGLGLFSSSQAPWNHGSVAWTATWLNSVQWSRYLLVLLWPIVVGAAAIQGMRDVRAGVGELFDSTPRPASHRALALSAAVGLAAALGYVAIVAVGAGQAVAAGGLFTTAWLTPLLLGVLSVFAGVTLGLGLGRLLPYPVTAPALSALALVGGVFLQATGERPTDPNQLSLLGVAQLEVRSPFAIPAPAVQLGQLVWFLGLAAAGFLLLAASARAKALAVVPAAAGLAIALPIIPASAADNFTADETASALVCDGPVCVTRLHENWLSTVAGPGKEALQILQKLPQHPSRVEESTATYRYSSVSPRDPARLLIQQDDELIQGVTGSDLTAELLRGAGTPRCTGISLSGAPSNREDAARWVMGRWLLGSYAPFVASRQPELGVQAEQAWASLAAAPEAEQTARVGEARRLELACTGDPLKVLTEGTS
ncbi:hypothetical protein [Amycolatopsis benzoatilytica]|uniref:hypothetical protein n=1 Tax=Amycolatopsis benzoatilytica TaxID=346045 RepID=UPI00036A57A4|nr:hypothetical protein [Amycolatopsis benzoatilytica]